MGVAILTVLTAAAMINLATALIFCLISNLNCQINLRFLSLKVKSYRYVQIDAGVVTYIGVCTLDGPLGQASLILLGMQNYYSLFRSTIKKTSVSL